jgi:tetratricopeptide (TPR) repeat protein
LDYLKKNHINLIHQLNNQGVDCNFFILSIIGLMTFVIFTSSITFVSTVNAQNLSTLNSNISQDNLGPVIFYNSSKYLPGNPQSSYYNNFGQELSNQGKYAEAIQTFDKALKIDPNNTVILLNKAIALDAQGNHDAAIQTFDKALKIDPNNPDLLAEKGFTLRNMGNYSGALTYFDKALEIHPNDIITLNDKGVTFILLKRYSDALSIFDKALEIDPNNIDALTDKVVALSSLGKNKEAFDTNKKILEIDPANKDAIKFQNFSQK